jgi:hydrogenase maturation protease
MWLIVGYGNRLRQDDGVGYRVVEILATKFMPRQSSRRIRVLAVHQLTPELALELAAEDVERVLFVDARRSQDKPLIMRKLDPAAPLAGSCGHHLAPELLLHMTRALYHRSPQGWLLTLATQQLEMGETFSKTAQSAITAALVMVEKILDKASKAATK